MKNKINSNQLLPFALSCGVFIVAAVLGWFKLQYGFNFTDEGWHMTEAWRLAAGDDFFHDKFTGALRPTLFVNFLVFKFYPGITLLGFRDMQFSLTIVSLLFMSFALYKVSKEFWFQPIIFSLFAFTGLEPMGAISNLNYYTYLHLFITFFSAFFILGLQQQSFLLKRILYVTAGIFLWLISFSLLHMSFVVISVIILFLVIRKLKLESFYFKLNDLWTVLLPVILLWIIFIGIYGNAYIHNVISSVQVILSPLNPSAGSLIYFNWETFKYVIITLFFIMAFSSSTMIQKTIPLMLVLLILAITMFAVIDTTFFGLITRYHRGVLDGWSSRPLWFAALLASSYLLFICYFIFKTVKKRSWSKFELLALILFIPGIIAAINGNIFSNLGMGTILYSSIIAVAAITCLILSMETVKKRTYLAQLAILLLFFAPFYYSTAWSDWKFTFFDIAPEQMNAEIETGFGRGIKTNQIYKNLYEWISATSQAYSNKDDYVISYIVSPMVHMIAQRRPALDESHINFAEYPEDYYDKSIELMKCRRRNPKLVYVFESIPALQPIDLKESLRLWQDKQISFPSNDPITRYVLANMTQIDSFPLAEDLTVRCFIDNSSMTGVLKNKLNINPANPKFN
jgi:hypothetical protein